MCLTEEYNNATKVGVEESPAGRIKIALKVTLPTISTNFS